MLERILRVTIAAEDGADDDTLWDGQTFPPAEHTAYAAGLIEHGQAADAASLLAGLAKISDRSAARIIGDVSGEPLTIIFKAIGISRADFAAAIERWRVSPVATLRGDRDIEELRTLFDILSYNKARVVLTYWDWLARKSGAPSESEM